MFIHTLGRLREFYQCDFDIAGVLPPMLADAEVSRDPPSTDHLRPHLSHDKHTIYTAYSQPQRVGSSSHVLT